MLLRNIHKLAFPPLAVYLVSNFLVDISPLWKAIAYILSIPCFLVITESWNKGTLRLEMISHGAQDFPVWEGKWPLSIDLLGELYDHWSVRQYGIRNNMKLPDS